MRDRWGGRDGCYVELVTKADLHALIDALPDESIDSVGALLRRAQDPVAAKFDAALYDDEPLTAEERFAVQNALAEPRAPWEQAVRELDAG
jgi:hypothetical protein